MGKKKEKTKGKGEDDDEEILCPTTRKSERLGAANAAVAAAAAPKAAAAAAAPAAVSPTATATGPLPPVILEGHFKGYMSPGYAWGTCTRNASAIYREAFEEWQKEETERLFTEVIPRCPIHASAQHAGRDSLYAHRRPK